MINQGVPQHIVQEMLGHESAQMTAHYAHRHGSTLRDAFDAYSRARVDVEGHLVVYAPDGATSDGEWMKEPTSVGMPRWSRNAPKRLAASP